MNKPRKTFATFEQVLFLLEDPELIVLSIGARTKVVAVACRRISDVEYFGVRVSIENLSEYLNEKFDLRYLFIHGNLQKWYEFDLPSFDEKIELRSVPLTPARIESYVPDHGLFANHHTSDYSAIEIKSYSRQRFNVDGQWDMKEFSKFHSYISDLYAVTRGIDIFVDEDQSLDVRRKVMESFVKPWEGGGSYFGFFKSLSKAGGAEYRPRVGAIQWASPGYIDVVGNEDSFHRLIDVLSHYGGNKRKIDRRYSELYAYMQEMRLLKQGARNFDRKSALAEEVNLRAKRLAGELCIVPYRELKKMAGNNPLVAAKVLLATERRVDRLHRFFAQGRLAASDYKVVPD